MIQINYRNIFKKANLKGEPDRFFLSYIKGG